MPCHSFPIPPCRLLAVIALNVLSFFLANSAPAAPLADFKLQYSQPIDAWWAIGLFQETNDEWASTTLASPQVEKDASIDLDRIHWQNSEPFQWTPAKVSSYGRLLIRQAYGPCKTGNTVFLYRAIQSPTDTQAIISLGSNGPLAAWLNGEPVLIPNSPWSAPGDDRWLRVVKLHSGANLLMIKSRAPDFAAPWFVSAAFLDKQSFSSGAVVYPRWQVSSSPSWIPNTPPEWVRWGDPEIQKFFQPDQPIPCSIQINSIGPKAEPNTFVTALGLDFKLPYPPSNDSRIAILSASIPAGATQPANLSFSCLQNSCALFLGSPQSFCPAASTLAKNSNGSKDDIESVLADLKDSTPSQRDPKAVRYNILRHTLDFYLADRSKVQPSGWIQFNAISDGKQLKYILQYPANYSPKVPAPLLLLLPPVQEDQFCVPEENAALAAEAAKQGWFLAVIDSSEWAYNDLFVSSAIDAVQQDIQKRVPLDPMRITVGGIGTGAPKALAFGITRSTRYSGIAMIDGEWDGMTLWQEMILQNSPRPALFVASRSEANDPIAGIEKNLDPRDGAWLRQKMAKKDELPQHIIPFLTLNPKNVAPARVTLFQYSPAQGPCGWIRVRQAQDHKMPVRIFADATTTNTITFEQQNVSQFDLLVKSIPNLFPGTLTLNIADQHLQVISRKIPEALRLSLVEKDDKSTRWEIQQLPSAAAFAEDVKDEPIAKFLAPMPALPDGTSTGIAGLLARSARVATGAQVAIIPANRVAAGSPAGDVGWKNIASWSPDSSLCIARFPAAVFLASMQKDYAGLRQFVTDGLNATVDPPEESLDPAQPRNFSIISFTTSWIPFAGKRIPGNRPPVKEQKPVFRSVSLANMTGDIVVVGWKDTIDRYREWIESTTKQPLVVRVQPCSLSQRQALMRFLFANATIPQIDPDIRSLPRKKAEDLKQKINH